MFRQINYYRTETCECPFEEFMDQQSVENQEKILFVLRLIQELERVPDKFFKKMKGTDDLWECRIKVSRKLFRVLSFFCRGDTLMLTHGFLKKTKKTDKKEIARAENYKKDFLSRHTNE